MSFEFLTFLLLKKGEEVLFVELWSGAPNSLIRLRLVEWTTHSTATRKYLKLPILCCTWNIIVSALWYVPWLNIPRVNWFGLLVDKVLMELIPFYFEFQYFLWFWDKRERIQQGTISIRLKLPLFLFLSISAEESRNNIQMANKFEYILLTVSLSSKHKTHQLP